MKQPWWENVASVQQKVQKRSRYFLDWWLALAYADKPRNVSYSLHYPEVKVRWTESHAAVEKARRLLGRL